MFTLGYNKSFNSLYKQNIESVIWPFKGQEDEDDLASMQTHIGINHINHYTSHNISQKILSAVLSLDIDSDMVSNGLFMSDFTAQPLTIDGLGFNLLEGAAHHYFTDTHMVYALVDVTLPYTNQAKGRRLWTSTSSTLSLDIGTVVGEVVPEDYVKIHSPGMINNVDDDIKPDTRNLESFVEVSPYVYQANPIHIGDAPSFRWGWNDFSKKTGKYQLDPDILPPDGFLDTTVIESDPTIVAMLSHISNSSLHPGSWTTPVLSADTTVSSDVISNLYNGSHIRTRPGTGDWYVTPEGGSMSYQEDLTEPVGHWLAISKGDPDAMVLDPDDSNKILGECVNGTDQMRCYFTLADGKFPVATPTVVLRRCNPVMGFTARTLEDFAVT